MFKMSKASAIKSRIQAINQLKPVLVRADPPLCESLTGLISPQLIGPRIQWRTAVSVGLRGVWVRFGAGGTLPSRDRAGSRRSYEGSYRPLPVD